MEEGRELGREGQSTNVTFALYTDLPHAALTVPPSTLRVIS